MALLFALAAGRWACSTDRPYDVVLRMWGGVAAIRCLPRPDVSFIGSILERSGSASDMRRRPKCCEARAGALAVSVMGWAPSWPRPCTVGAAVVTSRSSRCRRCCLGLRQAARHRDHRLGGTRYNPRRPSCSWLMAEMLVTSAGTLSWRPPCLARALGPVLIYIIIVAIVRPEKAAAGPEYWPQSRGALVRAVAGTVPHDRAEVIVTAPSSPAGPRRRERRRRRVRLSSSPPERGNEDAHANEAMWSRPRERPRVPDHLGATGSRTCRVWAR